MHSQDLGRVAIVPRGQYDPAAVYDRLDAVGYNGSSFMALKRCHGVIPEDGEYYMLMAQAGDSTAAETAAEYANAAALAAQGAANQAVDAANTASDAATGAASAAGAAEAAASEALSAAGSAGNAASEAAGAASQALAAAGAANCAATEATLAKDAAVEATTKANNAANNADAQAKDASDAASSARAATQNANDAAAAAQGVVVSIIPDVNKLKQDLSAEQTAREAADNVLRADLTANANADAVTRRSLDALWKLNQGISYQFETDDAAAYSKTVPSGAKLASVEQIGGNTVVWNQMVASDATSVTPVSGRKIVTRIDGVWTLITSDGSGIAVTGGTDMVFDLTRLFAPRAAPTSTDDPRIDWIEQYAISHPEYNAGELVSADVESVKHNNVVMADIPANVRNLPGYGWSAGYVCNSIERTETGWQYVQRVKKIYLKHVSGWSIDPINSERKYANSNNKNFPGVKAGGKLCTQRFVFTTLGEKNAPVWTCNSTGSFIRFILPFEYDTVKKFLELIGDDELIYELSSPIITDITDMMADFPVHFEVEAGGAITMENAAKLPVLSTEKYLISLAEVNQ